MTISSTPSARAIAARRRSLAGSLEGSAICKRRIPLRTTSLKESAITSSSAGTHEMKRIPVVIMLSGVFGIAALDQAQALPRVLPVKAHRDRHVRARGEVERVIADAVDRRRDREHVRRRQAGRAPQALVAVAQGGVDELDDPRALIRARCSSHAVVTAPARKSGWPSTLISSVRLVSTPSHVDALERVDDDRRSPASRSSARARSASRAASRSTAGRRRPASQWVSTRSPGARRDREQREPSRATAGSPRDGSSAFSRHSIAWPVERGRRPGRRERLAVGDPQLLATRSRPGDRLGDRDARPGCGS